VARPAVPSPPRLAPSYFLSGLMGGLEVPRLDTGKGSPAGAPRATTWLSTSRASASQAIAGDGLSAAPSTTDESPAPPPGVS
jgi:hypothetical protein